MNYVSFGLNFKNDMKGGHNFEQLACCLTSRHEKSSDLFRVLEDLTKDTNNFCKKAIQGVGKEKYNNKMDNKDMKRIRQTCWG